MNRADVVACLQHLSASLGPIALATEWHLFGSVDRDESYPEDIDLMILCTSDDQADSLRQAIDPDSLALPIHLSLMTFQEAAGINAVRVQRSRPIFRVIPPASPDSTPHADTSLKLTRYGARLCGPVNSNVRNHKLQATPPAKLRLNCPCCGYPTLPELNSYEICELCNWEDDGQSDDTADEVWGGPNADYSLSEARKNFQRYRVMYQPGRDQRITGQDSKLEYETKGLLMVAFDELLSSGKKKHAAIHAEIQRLEQVLQDETSRQILEYQRRV